LLEFTRAYARREDLELNILTRIWIECFENNNHEVLISFVTNTHTHTHTHHARAKCEFDWYLSDT